MMSVLIGVLAVAALFAVFGVVHRGGVCEGACSGCGDACAHRSPPAGRWDRGGNRVGR